MKIVHISQFFIMNFANLIISKLSETKKLGTQLICPTGLSNLLYIRVGNN